MATVAALMDPVSVVRTLRKHKLLTALLVAATVLGAAWAVTRSVSQFDSKATILLTPPPPGPTPGEVAENPALEGVRAENPYVRAYNPAIVINAVSSGVTAAETRDRLVAQGADRRYRVIAVSKYGYISPLAEIRATGRSAEQAQRTAQLVVEAFASRLTDLQSVEDVDPRYYIGIRLIEPPAPGLVVSPSRARAVVGVAGLGFLGLFSLVSGIDFWAQVRRERGGRGAHVVELSRLRI